MVTPIHLQLNIAVQEITARLGTQTILLYTDDQRNLT